MKLYLATDHAGFEMKEKIKEFLIKDSEYLGIEVVDLGATEHKDGDNYPHYMALAGRAVSADAFHDPSLAVIFGGSGQGEAMVANRFPHVRAFTYTGSSLELVKLAKEHNDANVISIGARFVNADQALEAVKLFIQTSFSHDERHAERIIQIEEETTNF